MAARNIAENDEDIIDLTELIEKGEAPANDAAVPAGQAEETLSAQIQSLNDLPQQADEEIDALLAQMEVKDDRAPAHEAAATRRVDPNEELDMPGMGEVDKLLDTLDIPPQPHEDGAAQAAAAHAADAGIMDSVVDDLLNSMSPTPPTHSGSDQKPDVYDLLSAASDPGAKGDALPDDLDALLHDNAPGAKSVPSSSAPRDSEPDLAADLDNLLAAAEKPVPPSDVAASAASKTPDLTEDLDSLLAAMTAEQGAAPQAAAPAPTQQSRSHDDTQTAEATAAQAHAVARPQPASEAAQAAAAGMQEIKPQAAQDAALETAPQSENEPAADLDSLPAAMNAEQDSPSSPADMPLTPQGEKDHAVAYASASGQETDSVQAAAPHDPAQPAADKEQVWTPEASAELDPDVLLMSPTRQSADEANAVEQALDAASPSACSLLDDHPEPVTALDDLLVAAVPEQTPCIPVDQGAVSLSAKEAPEEKALQRGPETSRADAEELVSLSVRLRHCEAELADARARIAALEKASGTAAASLEDLLRDGSPLHDRFAGLIASSVRQALQSAPAGITEQVLDERLQAVSLSNKSISARMDALETRLDHLEPRFNAQVEKAAAGAAARILREEIAKLVQS